MSKIIKVSFLFILSLSFYGCGAIPQSAEEFRAMVPGSAFGTKKTFVVKRDYSQVVSTFKKMSDKCLNKTITIKSSTGRAGFNYSQQIMTKVYTPTLKIYKRKSELHFQQDVKGGMMMAKIPKKGIYMLITDIIKSDSNRTKIDMYYSSSQMGTERIIDSVKSWAVGKNIHCPNLKKL